ncbi:hypothetical protein [Sphingomonas koreensis]|nr:hypothetical protein [Sphingomonas koreensis]
MKRWSFCTLANPAVLMAITDDEARRLIEHLELTVREAATQQDRPGITEIINQWRADVEAGRPVERKLTVRQSPGLDALTTTPRSSTTSSGEFVGTEDYSAIEQLDMLVTALGVALVAPQMMARRFMDAITTFSGPDSKGLYDPVVRLVGVADTDEPDGDGPARISRTSIDQSRQLTGALDKLLREIIEEADLPQRNQPGPREFA